MVMRQIGWSNKNTLRVTTHSNRTFRISRENFIDKFFVTIGYSKKIKIFNEQFDSKFYIESDDQDFIAFLRNDKEVQKLIMELMSLNIKAIEQSQYSLSAVFKKGFLKKEQYKIVEYNEQIIKLLEKIKTVLKELPNVCVNKSWTIWKLTLSIMLLFAGLALIFTYKDMNKIAVSGLFWEAVKYSIPLYMVLLMPALIRSFRTSYAHLVLLLNLGALLVIPFTVYPVLVYINIHYDNDAQGNEYCMYLDYEHIAIAKDFTDFELNNLLGLNNSFEFKSCDQSNFSFTLYGNRNLWKTLHYGDRVKAIIHKGKLGYSWSSGIILMDKQPLKATSEEN